MRKIIILIFATCFATSCSNFDDSDIWDKLNEHEYRIAYLEDVCDKMNTNIQNLQTIVTTLEANDCVVNASPLQDGSGYVVIFKSGKSIYVNHGKDGTDGKDGKDGVSSTISTSKDVDGICYWTINGEWLLVNGEKVRASAVDGADGKDGKDGVLPTISVMKDVDGSYYWTMEGEWLLVNGEKVRASAIDGADGKDGITPKFKIENNYWYISYDNGISWEILGKAIEDNHINGADVNDIFSNVSQDETFVYFYLIDGTTLILPKQNETSIQFEDILVKYTCCKYWDTNGDGELSYEEAAAIEEVNSNHKFDPNIVAFSEFKYFTNVKKVEYQVFSGTSLCKIELPSSMVSIENYGFICCPNLKYINFPNSITKIGSYAFSGALGNCDGGAAFTTIVLGNSINSIGECAFNTIPLKIIYCQSQTPPKGASNMFFQPHRIYVPKGSEKLYKNANYWKDYAVCIEEYDYEANPLN